MPKTSKEKMEYDMRYHAAKIKQISFKLNRETDADMISHLEAQPNIQGYLKNLIREDMKKSPS